MQPGGSIVLSRKARLLQRLKRPTDAIEALQELATVYSQSKQRDMLIGVYEQILKIDHSRKDVARALKKLHAGRWGGLRQLAMITGSILVAAAIGGWVLQGKLLTTALEVLRVEVRTHLIAGEMPAALDRVHQHELSHGLSEELIRIRAEVDATIRDRENNLRNAELEKWQKSLGEAGTLMNSGSCVEAMAVYQRLKREAPAQLRVDEAMHARMSSLITKLEKLEENLRPAIPPAPNDTVVIDDIEKSLTALERSFDDQDLQVCRRILSVESDENFISQVPEEDRTRLLKSAHAITEIFGEARRRRAQFVSWLNDARTTAGLQSVFQEAHLAARSGDFPVALQHYRTLMAKFRGGGGLEQRFKDRVKYYSTIIRYLKIIKRTTAEGSFAMARNQYRTLKREFPDEKFPMVRLPVRVETTPRGARVHVNGEERGISPLKLNYSPIIATRIRVELDGFYPEEAVLDGDAHEKVVSLLSRIPDWTVNVSGAVGYDPVVDGDGRVFIVDRSGTVTALEGRTGEVIWNLDTKDLSGLLPKPLVHDDRLVVASVDGTLRSLDRRTGKVRWERNKLPTELTPVIAGSTIAIISTKNELLGVHSGTGDVTFTVSLPGDVQVPPIVMQNRYILTVTTNGVVRKFDSRNGQVVWTEDGNAGRGVLSTPTVTTHGVVIPAEDGSLTLLDTQTGRQLWKQTKLGAVSLSVAHRGNLLFVAQENRVLSRSLKDGSAVESMTYQRPWTSPPTLLGDSLLVGNRTGQLYVLDPKSLAPKYQILSKGRIVAAPVLLANGVMVVVYENGRIHGFFE